MDQSSDILNCGGCGVACMVGQQCTNGLCTGTATGGDPTVPAATTSNQTSEETSNAAGDETGSAATDEASDESTALGVAPQQDGGCGCSTPGRTNPRSAMVLTALGGLFALALRRRRRR